MATDYIASYLKPATTIGVKDKLTAQPPKGVSVVFITCELPTCTDFSTGFKAAASQFSWNVSTLVAASSDPASKNTQIMQAVSLKPAAIVVTGGAMATWTQALAAAKSANIPIFETSAESTPLGADTGVFSNTPVTSDDRATAGKLLANWIITDSQAKARVLNVNVPEFKGPYSGYFPAFDSTLSSACANTCSTSELDVPVTDLLGGKLPGAIVSYLQVHPKITYINLPGGVENGVVAALKAAGLSKQVKIANASSSISVEQSIQSGDIAVAYGFPALEVGWFATNAIARHLAGLDAGDSATAGLPTALLTKATVGTPENFAQPSNYQQQFRTLWGLT